MRPRAPRPPRGPRELFFVCAELCVKNNSVRECCGGCYYVVKKSVRALVLCLSVAY